MNNLNFNPNQMEKDPLKIPIAIAEAHLVKGNPEFEQKDQKDPKIILLGVLCSLNTTLKKVEHETKQQKTEKIDNSSNFLEILKRLKKLFNALKTENSSQDIHFIQNLVHAYQDLSDQLNLINPSETKTDFFIHCTLLLDSLAQYPAGHPFTLGYYLKNYSGENWLPFPLMNIISQLHIEAATDSGISHLAIWIKSIDELTDNLDQNQISSPQVE